MAASAQAIVEGEVRELVRRRGIDPIAEPEVVARLVDEVVGDYRDRSITSALPPMGDVTLATRAVLDAVAGFGPLQPLLDDSTVEEIWINRHPTDASTVPFMKANSFSVDPSHRLERKSHPRKTIGGRHVKARFAAATAALIVTTGMVAAAPSADAAVTYRELGHGGAFGSLARGGLYATIETSAALVPQDTNNATDLYRINVVNDSVTLISRSSTGVAVGGNFNGWTDARTISSDGRYAIFQSKGAVLPSVPSGHFHTYRTDLSGGTVMLVDANAAGTPATDSQFWPYVGISDDGTKVAFITTSKLLTADQNTGTDVYLRNFSNTSSPISLVSTAANGAAIDTVPYASLSGNGGYVAFVYLGTELGVPLSGSWNVYRKNLAKGTTTRISNDIAVKSPHIELQPLSLSPDGTIVLFVTKQAYNSTDTNGQSDLYSWNSASNAYTWITKPGVGGRSIPDAPSFVEPSESSDNGTIVFGSTYQLTSSAATDRFDETLYSYRVSDGALSVLAPNAALGSSGFLGDTSQISGDGRRVLFDASFSVWTRSQ